MIVMGLLSLVAAELLIIYLSVRDERRKAASDESTGETWRRVAAIWLVPGVGGMAGLVAKGRPIGPSTLIVAAVLVGACIFTGGRPLTVAFGTRERGQLWRPFVGWLGIFLCGAAAGVPLYLLGYLA